MFHNYTSRLQSVTGIGTRSTGRRAGGARVADTCLPRPWQLHCSLLHRMKEQLRRNLKYATPRREPTENFVRHSI